MANPFVKAWKYLMASFSSKVDEHADPKVQIQQAIEEAQRQHQALSQQAASVIGNQRQLEMKLNRQLSEVERLQSSAQQAVTMATLARERGGDAEVRGLAFDIETNQRDQIGRMQGWLNLWGQPPQASGPPMQWMHGGEHQRGGEHQHGGMAAGAGMPGMADSAELARLRTLRGPAFDTEFLRLMLRHHEGGAPMARYGAEHAALAPVRGLASNMLGSQATESELMRAMLAARGAAPLPPG